MGSISKIPEGTHTVAIGFGDLNGIMRGKRIPSHNWENVCKNGTAICLSALVYDMTCDVWDTPVANNDNGYPDMHIFPQTQPVPLPWEPGVAISFANIIGMDHKPVSVDSRRVLERQVNRAKQLGYEIMVGTELEFFLLDPATKKPKDEGIQVYSLERASELEHVLGPIRRHLTTCGIPIEQSNPEYASGQVEVNIKYDDPLTSADRVIMFRSLVKQIARQHGYLATFMPKPFLDASGSGFHCHYSLWHKTRNIFSNNGKLSEEGEYFIGGMQKYIAESTICGSMNVNGYRRKEPYTFCPTNNTWGYDNRSAAIRVIQGSENSTRLEKRDAGADCNPYLRIAADIASGLDGLEKKIKPSKLTTGDAYKDKDSPLLPNNIVDAIKLAKESKWLESILGEQMLLLCIQQCERELNFFRQQVTEVEIQRYLTNL